MKVIAICGRIGAGKSTLAFELWRHGYYTYPFAAPFKRMLAALLHYQLVPEKEINRMLEGDLKETPSVYFDGATPRQAMRTLGDWGRNIHVDFWVNKWKAAIRDKPKVSVPDLRFKNEAYHVTQIGGIIIRIEREGESTDTHISEIEQRSIQADHTIVNDGTPLDMLNELVSLIGRENL